MPLSALEAPYFKSTAERYEQGDILRDIKLIEWAEATGDEISIAERSLQYCVLVTQDCDLEHDFDNRADSTSTTKDKYLQSLLLCPAYPGETFRTGEHLAELGFKMQAINSDRWRLIKQNNVSRYHYLEKALDYQVPELVVDFKHYLTAPRDVFYRSNFSSSYVATIEIVYREHLSGRFAHYLSRIGLPELTSP